MKNLSVRFSHIFFLALGFISLLMISFLWIGYEDKSYRGFNQDHVYQTWKIKKLYQNGKSVEDDPKFIDLKLKVNRDGTAEWIRPGQKLVISFRLINEATQIILDDGYTIEDIETVFELTESKFRFGKKNIATRYEYVMVPDDSR